MPSFHLGVPILDIIFVGDQPTAAAVGGALLNTAVSLARGGAQAYFVSALADDRIAGMFRRFLEDNYLSPAHFHHSAARSLVSLAFKAEQTEYDFRGEIPFTELASALSGIDFTESDVLHYGDFFVFNAKYDLGAVTALTLPIRYLDVNVRGNVERQRVSAVLGSCDVLRCSKEDYEALFGESEIPLVIASYPNIAAIIRTSASVAYLYTRAIHAVVYCPRIPEAEMRSTIGAGDSFNAGVIWRMQQLGITRRTLPALSERQAGLILSSGVRCAQAVCRRDEGYVGGEFRFE